MSKLRGGLFGCGMISEFHLRGWQRIPEVEIVAFGDQLLERAAERRAQFFPQAEIFDDLNQMLSRARLDFLDILTPPALHRQHCLLAKKAGVHIICQKPLCDNLADAHALVSELHSYPKLFAVHENHRYRPWFRSILQLHAEGFFGRVQCVRLSHLNATAPAESYKLASEQGILLEYGTHLVDMMIALFGEPERVYARAHRLHPQVRGESLVHAVYEYPQATAIIEVGWKQAGLLQAGVLVQGDEGEAYYEGTLTRGATARFRQIRRGEVIVDEVRAPAEDYAESFYLFQRECADAMLRGSPVTQSGEANLRTLVSTFAAYRSVQAGNVVFVRGQTSET